MASVVGGISGAAELLGAGMAAEAAVTTAAAPCGAAAFAACSFTRREMITTDTTGKTRITHRIFMKTSIFAAGWNHTAGGRLPSSLWWVRSGTSIGSGLEASTPIEEG